MNKDALAVFLFLFFFPLQVKWNKNKEMEKEERERLVSRKRATANKQNGKTAASLKSTKINIKRPELTHLKKCVIEKCNIRIEKNHKFYGKTVGFSGTQTWIVGVESKHSDHLTTTAAQFLYLSFSLILFLSFLSLSLFWLIFSSFLQCIFILFIPTSPFVISMSFLYFISISLSLSYLMFLYCLPLSFLRIHFLSFSLPLSLH